MLIYDCPFWENDPSCARSWSDSQWTKWGPGDIDRERWQGPGSDVGIIWDPDLLSRVPKAIYINGKNHDNRTWIMSNVFLYWWFSLSFYVFFLENQEFPSEPWFSVRNSATIRCHTVQGRVWGNLAKRLRAGSQGFSVRRCWEVGRWCCLFFLMGKWTCWNMFNKNIYTVCLDGNVVSLAHTLFLWVIQTLDIFQWETRHHSTPCSEDGWRSKDLQIGWRSEPWFVFVKHCLYLF